MSTVEDISLDQERYKQALDELGVSEEGWLKLAEKFQGSFLTPEDKAQMLRMTQKRESDKNSYDDDFSRNPNTVTSDEDE